MADRVDEVTLPEGTLRIELDATEVDGAGCLTAYLNGVRITKERAEELIARARSRTGRPRSRRVRDKIAAYVEAFADNYPEDVFPPDSDSRDAIGGTAMRHAYRNAARAIREDFGAGGEHSDDRH